MRIYAQLTEQGTAAAETAVCSDHKDHETQAAGDVLPGLVDCTGNDALVCVVCGVEGE